MLLNLSRKLRYILKIRGKRGNENKKGERDIYFSGYFGGFVYGDNQYGVGVFGHIR